MLHHWLQPWPYRCASLWESPAEPTLTQIRKITPNWNETVVLGHPCTGIWGLLLVVPYWTDGGNSGMAESGKEQVLTVTFLKIWNNKKRNKSAGFVALKVFLCLCQFLWIFLFKKKLKSNISVKMTSEIFHLKALQFVVILFGKCPLLIF